MNATEYTAQDEAAYRVILKRILCPKWLDRGQFDKPTDSLASLVRDCPADLVAHYCTQAFQRSAKAWEDGNNSGNDRILQEKEAESVRWATAGERVMALFGIRCDWPGLYPSFEIVGQIGHYYDALSVLKAATQVVNA